MAVEQPGKCNKNITRRSNGQFSKAASVPLGPRRHASEETVVGEISGPTPLGRVSMSKARFRVHRGMGIKHMRRNKDVRSLADRREQSLVARKANRASAKARKG